MISLTTSCLLLDLPRSATEPPAITPCPRARQHRSLKRALCWRSQPWLWVYVRSWFIVPVALTDTLIEFGNVSDKLLVPQAADGPITWLDGNLIRVISPRSANDALQQASSSSSCFQDPSACFSDLKSCLSKIIYCEKWHVRKENSFLVWKYEGLYKMFNHYSAFSVLPFC